MHLQALLPLLLTSASLVAALPNAAAAAAAPAATTGDSSSSSGDTAQCAKSILDACLKQLQPQMSACGQNDWSCLCTQSQNVLTCYSNCPSDPGRYTVSQQEVSYCNAAQANSLLYSTSTKVTKTASATKTIATATTTAYAKSTAASATATSVKSSGAAAGTAGLELGLGVAAVVLGVWGI
ncbi:GPI anchored serine-threonine rich protein [Aspergillus saccharolyticus JOP 1030-1]|uniref:GPI anchored serine-threonine rich protein n=1 Tax=Aspergillus saccharolyticus JOP 1030-1 TaxID=1450539 RepID=A0A319A1I4_9EURO|nr:hypothetical protein BP01DRAFT_364923 [Aspergillus saccharolyticus JOP 1030-1]PYH46148.1 hypothetical protein BP01DRAFT_364923 [Aspergillus saccharolyticus JOP 1030-1]